MRWPASSTGACASGRPRWTPANVAGRSGASHDRQHANPLRTVHLACHGWQRDPVAVVGDWLWCDACGDHRRVDALRE